MDAERKKVEKLPAVLSMDAAMLMVERRTCLSFFLEVVQELGRIFYCSFGSTEPG